MNIEIKAGRRKFVCTLNDRIMYNGVCYQLITQSFYKNWYYYTPKVSEQEFKRLTRLGVLSEPYRRKLGSGVVVTMYDFIFKDGAS